uniref:Uncharacterized protein n=1 Tax=Romanomermis culicivorax TaxID=13658 RepID=A0A915J284_ROMCU
MNANKTGKFDIIKDTSKLRQQRFNISQKADEIKKELYKDYEQFLKELEDGKAYTENINGVPTIQQDVEYCLSKIITIKSKDLKDKEEHFDKTNLARACDNNCQIPENWAGSNWLMKMEAAWILMEYPAFHTLLSEREKEEEEEEENETGDKETIPSSEMDNY